VHRAGCHPVLLDLERADDDGGARTAAITVHGRGCCAALIGVRLRGRRGQHPAAVHAKDAGRAGRHGLCRRHPRLARRARQERE
jgi:hypothetical protein